MDKLIKKIVLYFKYLNTVCNLNVSVHFDRYIFDCLPEEIANKLLPFNSHTNICCISVKGKNYNKCLENQKLILKKCNKDESFCNICHAGICEYIYPIFKENKPAGYITVSGYKHMKNIPSELCSMIIPPLAVMLEQLLSDLSTESETEYNLIRQFLNEYHAHITLSDLSRHFKRSKSHISHLFKTKSGITIRAYCNNLKLDDAKNLLINTDIPITEIAFDVGFNDTSYFISLFKERFNISPLQYRKKKMDM